MNILFGPWRMRSFSQTKEEGSAFQMREEPMQSHRSRLQNAAFRLRMDLNLLQSRNT